MKDNKSLPFDKEYLNKSYRIGNYVVKLSLSNFCFEIQDKAVFGFCYDKNNYTRGFCYLEFENNGRTLVFKNDMFGGYRLYYWEEDQTIYITDHIFSFLHQEDVKKLERNEPETEYWKKHGYTSGDSTLYSKIKKMPPASMLEITEEGCRITLTCEFADIQRLEKVNTEAFRAEVDTIIQSVLLPLKNNSKRNILCFSGGVDSMFLAQKLIFLHIDFELVFFLDSKIKMQKALSMAKKKAILLNKQLIIIDITDQNDPEIEKEIGERMWCDRHYSRVHFYGVAGLVKKFGPDITVINGQNSDAILSYGPSEEKFTSFLKRYLLYGHSYILKDIIALIISFCFRKKLKVPGSEKEMFVAFYDNFKYCLLLDRSKSEIYNSYLKHKIISVISKIKFSSRNNLWMYLKLYTYVQASDNQVVLQSAKSNGVDLIMPFTNADFVKTVLKYKNDKKELYNPKYVLKF